MLRRRLAFLLAVLGATGSADANGRFPRAQRLVEAPDDPDVLATYATYGLLVTRNGGTSWRHICEAATGTYSGEDPLLEILPEQRLLARTETELVRSGSEWCRWETVFQNPNDLIQDITRDPTAPGTILALIGSYEPSVGFSSRLFESSDGGSTWGDPKNLPREQVARGLSLDVAPTSSFRVVVTALDANGAAHALVSEDRGETWISHRIAGADSTAAPYLAAIAKTNPDRFYVRTDTYRVVDGIDTANDALLLTTNRGETFTSIFERRAKLLGFALSPDDKTLLLGYGDPVVAATYVAPEDLGIYRATVADILADPARAASKFEKIYEGSITCLRWTSRGLYACTSQSEKGFEIGKAADADFSLSDPNPFEPLLLLPEVVPLACPANTSAHACPTDPQNGFAAVCGLFQAPCDAAPAPIDGPAPDASAGNGGAAIVSTGGSIGVSGSAGATSAGGTGSRNDDSESTCACRQSKQATGSAWWTLMPLLAAARRTGSTTRRTSPARRSPLRGGVR